MRYYEREGLLKATRSGGGHRLFDPAELERLNFIISLREAGWSLEEITSLLSIRARADGGREACRELTAEVDSHIDRLQQKIDVLKRLHGDLQETRRLLAVCGDCTVDGEPLECAGCERLPVEQPAGFRLTWLAEGRGRRTAFDEPSAPNAVDVGAAGSPSHPPEER